MKECEVSFTLEPSGVPRPDGAVPLPIDGRELVRRAGLSGDELIDFHSLRIEDCGTVHRDAAAQWVPASSFDPVSHPVGTLWFRLWKYTWEDTSFPRKFVLRFHVQRGASDGWMPRHRETPSNPLRLTVPSPEVAEVLHRDGTGRVRFDLLDGRKPAFAELRTPLGRRITADRPRDHPWHRGLWFGWNAVYGPSVPEYAFWCEPAHAVYHHEGYRELRSGAVMCGFACRSLWCTPAGRPTLRQEVRVQVEQVDNAWLWLDLELALSACMDGTSLSTSYGHLMARAAMELEEPYILDSESEAPLTADDPKDKAVRWIGFGGRLDGSDVSLLMLDHPSNPGGPCRRDFAFERRAFPIEENALFLATALNPVRERSLPLEVTRPAAFRYRVVVADRRLSKRWADDQFRHWTTPWAIRWS